MERTASRKDTADLSLMVGGDSIVKIETMTDLLFNQAILEHPDAIAARDLASDTIWI